MVLAIPDSADEAAYVPAMESAGYILRIREPGWFEHRLFKGPDTNVNVHVFTEGSPEIERMLVFRDCGRTSMSGSSTSGRNVSWRLATGRTSSTTRTPRARWSRRSSLGPSQAVPAEMGPTGQACVGCNPLSPEP